MPASLNCGIRARGKDSRSPAVRLSANVVYASGTGTNPRALFVSRGNTVSHDAHATAAVNVICGVVIAVVVTLTTITVIDLARKPVAAPTTQGQ